MIRPLLSLERLSLDYANAHRGKIKKASLEAYPRGGTMKIIAFLTDYSVLDGIVFGLKLGTYPIYFLTRSGTKTFH